MLENPSGRPPRPDEPAPAPPPVRSRRRWILAAVVLLVLVGVFVLRRGKGATQLAGPGAGARVVPVGVTPAERRDVPIWVEGLGNVTSLATVTVRARVSGQILSVAFQEGTRVTASQDRWSSWIPAVQDRVGAGGGHLPARPRDPAHRARDLVRYKDLAAQKLIAQQQYDAQVATVGPRRPRWPWTRRR